MGLFLIMEHIIPKEELRLVYGEIVRGSSYFNSKKYGDIIIKHLTQEDTEMLDVKKLKYKRKAEEKGLPTEQEKIEDLIKDSLWSHEKERDIKASKDLSGVNLIFRSTRSKNYSSSTAQHEFRRTKRIRLSSACRASNFGWLGP